MRNKLTLVLCGLAMVFAAQLSARAGDLVAVEKLPEHVQETIYKSALDLNKEIEKELTQMGLANSSLQDAILEALDKYADKGGPLTVYKFPTDKVEDVAKLLDLHERANERIEIISARLQETQNLLGTLKHKLADLEDKKK